MEQIRPDSEETVNLLHLTRDNDESYDQLFERHRTSIKKFVEIRLDDKLRARIDASDIVQETQVEVFRRLDDFLDRRPMPFHIWLKKTAHERLIETRRQHLHATKRAVAREISNRSSVLLADQLLESVKSPSQLVSEEEVAGHVRDAVNRLSENDREILIMRSYECFSYKEIAYILEIRIATARKRYGRALLQLHKLLAERGISESNL